MKKILVVAWLGVVSAFHALGAVPTCADLQAKSQVEPGHFLDAAQWEAMQKRFQQFDEQLLQQLGFQSSKVMTAVVEPMLYWCGVGVAKDVGKGLRLLEKEATTGNSDVALFLVGVYAGGLFGIERDDAKALHWVRFGASQGSPLLQATLGQLLYVGHPELPKDDVAAERWLVRAASSGVPGIIGALGDFYTRTGRYADGLRWLRIGSASGDRGSNRLLSSYYSNGWDVRRNQIQARHYMKLAAELKLPEAQFQMGRFYAQGGGAERDMAEAVRWFRLAADQGYPEAVQAMVNAYEYGDGVPVNLQEALVWRQKLKNTNGMPAQNLQTWQTLNAPVQFMGTGNGAAK